MMLYVNIMFKNRNMFNNRNTYRTAARIRRLGLGLGLLGLLALGGCLGDEPEGLWPAPSATTTVKFDFLHKPLPEIPLPNDIATRYDSQSATGRRINASLVATTRFESQTRKLIDQLDGWGIFQTITIPFSGPLDIASILAGHDDPTYDPKDDVIYLINVDPASPEFGALQPLDVGNGNYPVVLESLDKYWKNDPRGSTLSLLFEETDEDTNQNGKLDPGEDTDADGVLDRPNYLPWAFPSKTDLAGRADALMTFYERQTNTLLVRPMTPLRERTTYAVVVTRRILDAAGKPVGSPFAYINHTAQNAALAHLPAVLPSGLKLEDVAFAFSFTTQSVQSHMRAVRDGLYGHGVQAQLGTAFPAQVKSLEILRNKNFAKFANSKIPTILPSEYFVDAFKDIATGFLGMKENTENYKIAYESQKYVDFHVVGSFSAPQLFQRRDAKGDLLPLNQQSWPPDLDRVAATARDETVYFWMTVPRKEVSVRKDGKPAPLVIVGHGYGGNRTDILGLGGLMAKHGMAAIAIDCPSHGLGLSASEKALGEVIVKQYGLEPFLKAVLTDRAFDQNGDGTADSGADFWSAYVFHTRDMVRQSALDYMQLVRVLRSFDGTRTWTHDVNGDGKPELAGDFDADGVVDVGGSAHITMTGGSLGGIMSMTVGGAEPEVTTVAPVAGGAGLGDVGIRSRQGGVPEAFILRVMGPLVVGTLDSKSTTGEMSLEFILPDLNHARTLAFAQVKGVKTGDTLVVHNLSNKERACGVVATDGTVRAGIAADNPVATSSSSQTWSCYRAKGTAKETYYRGDSLRVELYSGPVVEGTGCTLKSGVSPYATVDTFEKDLTFQDLTCDQKKPLIAPTEGLGLRRADPEFRRFTSFASFIIEPGDPVAYLPGMLLSPPIHAGATAKGTHALIITTLGDMNVPASSGVTAGRAAGIIDYRTVDPRYGVPPNQKLVTTYTAEAVNTLKRFKDSKTGEGVHLDVDNFSQGTDMWGTRIPRLSSPMRLGMTRSDGQGGISAAIFPLSNPTGTHGFDMPGEMTDAARKACASSCTLTTGTDPCGCTTLQTFDIGNFMFNMIGRYFASDGKSLNADLCNSRDDCSDKQAAPKARELSTLP